MNIKKREFLVLFAATLLLVWCIPASGQVLKGSMDGVVVDPQGAVVPGVQVKVTNIATGLPMVTTTDNSGTFRLNLIQAGEYKVEFSAPNFKNSVQNNVIVAAGAVASLGTVKLEVGPANTTVEVTANAPLIETSQAQVTNTFSGVALSTFAGVQENQGLDNLALFVPGVVSARDNGFSNSNGGLGFSVNGIRGRNNDQQIDGQNNNDNSVGGPSLFLSDPEFVSQYVFVTNNFGPEYGRNAGSVVNIITKSGGNAWHGSVFEVENNSILNALGNNSKQFLGLSQPLRLNNEFGGFTVGGPVVKNKVFLFGGFDQQIISTNTQMHTDNLTPTPAGLAQLNGCFPTSTTLQAFNRFGPFGISAGNPVATPVPFTNGQFAAVDVNNGVTDCANVEFGGITRTLSTPTHNFDFITRMDVQTGNNTLTGRYLFSRGNTFNNDFGQGANGYPVNVPALSQIVMLSWTRNLNSHMVNEVRGSFGRLNLDFGGNTIGTVPTGSSLDQALAQGTIFASGFAELFGTTTALPQFRIVNTWQAQDNFNYVIGRHQLKAGVNWTYQRSPNGFLPNVNGAYRYDDWSHFIADVPDRVRIASGPTGIDFREYDTFLYAGDDWKITKNLTLNLGLTWSYYGQPANIFNSLTTARETNPATAFWATQEPANLLNPGSAIPLSVRTVPSIPAPKNSFGPSVGFAYSPQWGGFLTGNGRTVIRGGYRLLYDPPFYNIYTNLATSAPEVFLQSFTSGLTAPQFQLPAVPTGPNVRAQLSASITKGAFDPRQFVQTQITPNFGPDKVHAWSLGAERELSKNSAVEIRYAGNHATDLFQSANSNPFIAGLAADFPNLVPAGLTPCPAANALVHGSNGNTGRVSCTDAPLAIVRNNQGYSNYNSAQVEYRANNLFKQLTIRSSYTYSKNLDNVSEIFSTFGGGNTVSIAQNPVNIRGGEYSFSGLDIPHQWSLLFTEQLPFFKEQHGVIGHVLGGWSLSGNYVLASGQRYTPASVGTGFISDLLEGKNYFDNRFDLNVLGIDQARPFFGSKSAPVTSVGIFASDACDILGGGFGIDGGDLCPGENPTSVAANTLVSMNAINQSCLNPIPSQNGPCKAVPVQNSQVRYIINGFTAQQVFGTPFGNVPRGSEQDAISNIANFSVFKNVKISEHTAFEFHATFLNAFNHFNFSSVDPFLEDAGFVREAGTGFGDPTVTPASGRTILFGGKFTF